MLFKMAFRLTFVKRLLNAETWKGLMRSKTHCGLDTRSLEAFRLLTHLLGSVGLVFACLSSLLAVVMWKVESYFWMLFLNAVIWALIAVTEFVTFFRIPAPGQCMRTAPIIRALRDHTVGVAVNSVVILFNLYQFTPSHVFAITKRIFSNQPDGVETSDATGEQCRGSSGEDRSVIINVLGVASFVALILLCVTEWMCAVCYFQATQTRYKYVRNERKGSHW